MKKLQLVIFLIPLIFSACLDLNKPKLEENGLTKEINNLVPQSIIDEMKTLGMPINSGNTPPSMGIGTTGNIYKASPFTLINSNRSSDTPGSVYSDYYVKFYGQDNSKLTLTVDYSNGGETGVGLGSFIVGKGSKFTIFAEVNSTYLSYSAIFVHVISGTLNNNKIEDLYFANFMIDNNGNPGGVWIENGEGRIFYDSDGDSPQVESFSAAPSQKAKQVSLGIGMK